MSNSEVWRWDDASLAAQAVIVLSTRRLGDGPRDLPGEMFVDALDGTVGEEGREDVARAWAITDHSGVLTMFGNQLNRRKPGHMARAIAEIALLAGGDPRQMEEAAEAMGHANNWHWNDVWPIVASLSSAAVERVEPWREEVMDVDP